MNTEYEHPTPSETTDLPGCELCGHYWVDLSLSSEEMQPDIDSINLCGRCVGCVEEWGEDGYPDR